MCIFSDIQFYAKIKIKLNVPSQCNGQNLNKWSRYEMIYNHFNLELFCDANTPILLVPCHFHKQKLNAKKHYALFIYLIWFLK